ncbi:helix-turn-helix domain-containing protein [Micromonospora sp. NBC_01655]|uniref:helix-turn-helix domain-containing protein n=1 Tax=Micromonospora sp. NBC_01655 TaxID=2975983 RepID=UPI0022550898|nr:helix-turn-helix transcriptional regulator [Micromonospora sp. NBC_01655]MCX4468981.1 helix-turn-helix domain-containing protein [Micromonospora sp. NBC_01655]
MAISALGRQLRAQRGRRHMTQAGLASAAGVSVDLIRKLEQGQRQHAGLDSIARLAAALDVTLADLLDKPRGLAAGAEDGELGALRRAILGLTPTTTAEPPSLDEMRAAVVDLWQTYWAGQYAHLARQLPDRITQARALAAAAAPRDQAAASTLLAGVMQLTGSLLAHLAHEDLAHLALAAADRAAEAAGDELLHAAQQATRAWVLSRQGLWAESEHVAMSTAAAIEPRLSRATADHVAVWGELLRYGCTAVARSGRHGEATELLGLVQAAAARLGSDGPTRYVGGAFGVTVAAMKAVDVAVTADRPRAAIRLAERVEHPNRVPTAMHARYLLNVAWAQTADWRSQDAVDTLRRVDRIAPEVLDHQTLARVIIEELLPRRSRQRLPGLIALADRVGVPR